MTLRRAHSQLVVQVLQLETREAVEHLRGGDADLAVVHHMPGVAVPETAGLQRRRLLVDHLYVVVPEGHRLARRDAVSVTDLEAEPLILPRRDTPAGRFRSLVEHLCAQAGFEPRVAYELDDLPAAQAFVAAGIAVVPMHGLILATLPPGATARPLAERPAGSRTIEALAPAASAHRGRRRPPRPPGGRRACIRVETVSGPVERTLPAGARPATVATDD